MTEQEAITAMWERAHCPESNKFGDTETAHQAADDILLEFLRANGYADLADAFDAAYDSHNGFWYA